MPASTNLLALLLAAVALLAYAPTDAAAQARTDTQTIRTWEETVKDGTQETTIRVEVAFDYARGVPVRRTFDASGTFLNEEVVSGQPRPSPAEIDEATALIEADAEMAALLEASGATIEGGFVYYGSDFATPITACETGARCLQFDLVAPSRTESVRFVVVDLATRSIVERNLFPEL